MQKSQTTQEPGLLLSPPRSSPGNVLLVPFLVEKRQNHRFRWRHNVEKESFEKYWWSTLAW
ncbi:Hypothetical predicted protein [Paramuricea clavata]|uniref:Uncharacterized protein n=1 Tax=Paramuricea clavata TaxID=317549 RepID=A0A6S7I1U3_PARCT|nr:Hypothetical predicted protein [Paramuricea clavata]